jgi:SecD/SecF fusion protein
MPQFRWRAVAVVAVLAATGGLMATRSARLGLDLRGGTQIALEAKETGRQKVDGDTMNRTLEVLRRRVDQLGVAEPTLQRSGDRRIIVELPGLKDPDRAVAVIGQTAQLAFHPVLGVEADGQTTTSTATGSGVENPLVLPDEDGSRIRLGPPALTGDGVRTAKAVFPGGGWQVEVEFRGDGQGAWETLTGKAACAPAGDPTRRIAITLDQKVISSPQVSPEIRCNEGITGGSTVITGDFSQKEAKELALLIRAGALPVPVEIVEQRTIGRTLGQAAIRASVEAALIGAALTILYMVAYYRLLGVLAAVALVAYSAISFAVLLALDATLTLPGIAGFVLAIGMAVDANVLVFERIKEEHAAGATVRLAARNGFSRAWTAIVDSNATTVLAALLLFFYASGAVRGFGITLTIGVVASMFSALVLTRLLVDLTVRPPAVGGRPGKPRLLGLQVGGRLRAWLETRRPNLVGKSRRWLALSAVAVVLAVSGLVTRGLDYGLEFSGGRLVEYDTAQSPDLDEIRAALAGAGFPRAMVQESGEGNVAVRTPKLSADEETAITTAIEGAAGRAELVREEFVGPTIGDELRRKAAIALGLALLAQLAYLAIRFRWTYGSAAVVAMFHDVAILLGIFAWLGKAADGVFLAALLTVIGYSVNDSVVVFDRIRELRRARPKDPLVAVANDACLQTVPRTINTGLGALFILVALYLLGGETLADFALALLIGILVGTYSSVFTATPLLIAFEQRGSLPDTAIEPPRRRTPPESPAEEPIADRSADPVKAAVGTPRPRPARPAGRPAGTRSKRKRR